MAQALQTMRKYSCGLVVCGLLALPSPTVAHGAESHAEDPAQAAKPAPSSGESRANIEASKPETYGATSRESPAHATLQKPMDTRQLLSMDTLIRDLSFSAFPTLHPMVVHVPVILIPLAFVFSLISLFSVRRSSIWLVFGLALGGLAGGLVAAFPLHPHTTGLPTAAKTTLMKHDFFAYGTLWLTLIAVVVALICLYKPGRLPRVFLSLALLLRALCVSIAGHYGGTLAYVHGVGTQGQYLAPH